MSAAMTLPFPNEVAEAPFLWLNGEKGGFLHHVALAADGKTLDLGFDVFMTRLVYDWINQALAGTRRPVDGLIRGRQARTEIVFGRALITRTTLPALDASWVGHPQFEITLRTEALNRRPVSGPTPAKTTVPLQKTWRGCDFRLQIDGVDSSRVEHVSAVRVDAPSSRGSDSQVLFQLTFPVAASATFKQWQQATGGQAVRNGTLAYLRNDLRTEHGHVELTGLLLLGLVAPTLERSSAQIRRMVATLSCEQLQLEIPPPLVH